MFLQLNKSDCSKIKVDRDGCAHDDIPGQGMEIVIGDLQIMFYDERDAEHLSLMILERLGYDISLAEKMVGR